MMHEKTGLVPMAAAGFLCSMMVVTADSRTSFPQSMEDLWKKAVLYQDSGNPLLQKLVFTGRAQADFSVVEGKGSPAAGVTESDLDGDFGGWRRLRAGFKARVFGDFTLHAEGDFDPDEDPYYQRLTDAYLAWAPCGMFELKAGKQGMGYTLDGATSSKELLTIDRNNLSNNLWFTNEYLPGVTMGGKAAGWSYNLGFFSQGEEDGEFGNFNGGTSWLASVGYDLSGLTGGDVSVVALDYVFNEETPANPALFANRSLGHVCSLNFTHEKGPFGLRGDFSAGDGFLGQSDIRGLALMPYYNFNENLQAVFRYTFVASDSDNGVRFARYESELVPGRRGDQYQEAYLGLNYLIYGHKLKLQSGVQYASMRDPADDGGAYDGFSWTTGLRLSW